MGASTAVPSMIFCTLAKDFEKQSAEVQADRKKLAKSIRKAYKTDRWIGADADFNDGDLDCYEQLFVLGLAKRCKRCDRLFTDEEKDEHGEDTEYGDCKE